MKNIGIVTTWFERGAAYVSKQYADLLEKEFNVFIYARGGESYAKGDPVWDTGNVYWAKRPIAFYDSTRVKKKDFKKWITQHNIETVFFNEQHWWRPIIWCKKWGIKTIAYVDYYTEITVPFFSLYDALICNTKRHAEAFSWHKNMRYIPWGTNPDLFSPGKKEEKDTQALVFFLSLGMNPDRKGFYPALKAFTQLNEPNCKLLIQSQVPVESYLKDLREIFASLKEQGKIELIEKTVSTPGLYHRADVYLYLSKLDGIGLTVPEALACGLPVIAPDNPPMNEFVTNKVGRLVSVTRLYARGDAYYWPQCEVSIASAKKAMQYFTEIAASLPEMKQKIREYALESLNWKDREKEVVNVFKQVRFKEADKTRVNDVAKWQMKKDHIWGKIPILYILYKFVEKRKK